MAFRILAHGHRHTPGAMNGVEKSYASHLALRQRVGEIEWFAFEAIKLRLADNTFYTSDFLVMLPDGQLECHEVKGRKTDKRTGKNIAYAQDDARVKIKVAAELFPFRFVQAWPARERGGWQFEYFNDHDSEAFRPDDPANPIHIPGRK